MKTEIYDDDGHQIFSQSISTDQIKVSIDDLEQLKISINAKNADAGNFVTHTLEFFQIIEQVCHQLKSYNSSGQDFNSGHFRAELRRYVSKYLREDEISEDGELFNEHASLMPPDRWVEQYYKFISYHSRQKHDIRCLERLHSLTLALQDVIENKKTDLETAVRLRTESNPEIFSVQKGVSIEEKWARFFASVLGVKAAGSDIDLDEIIRFIRDGRLFSDAETGRDR